MKRLFFIFIQVLFLSYIFCTGGGHPDDKGLYEKECFPPELEVENTTEYVIEKLFIHDAPNYGASESILTNEMDPDVIETNKISVPISHGDLKYFTFVRRVTTTSEQRIAVTTRDPVSFSDCHKYFLKIIEEDFLAQIEDNYVIEDASDDW